MVMATGKPAVRGIRAIQVPAADMEMKQSFHRASEPQFTLQGDARGRGKASSDVNAALLPEGGTSTLKPTAGERFRLLTSLKQFCTRQREAAVSVFISAAGVIEMSKAMLKNRTADHTHNSDVYHRPHSFPDILNFAGLCCLAGRALTSALSGPHDSALHRFTAPTHVAVP